MQPLLRHLPWIVAAATAGSCLLAHFVDRDWMIVATVFSIATLLLVLPLIFPDWRAVLQQLIAASHAPEARTGSQAITRPLTWMAAGATALSWLAVLVSGDDEWVMVAIVCSVVTVLLVLSFAFRGQFTALQRFSAGMAILVIVVVVGLFIIAAGLAGLGSIK